MGISIFGWTGKLCRLGEKWQAGLSSLPHPITYFIDLRFLIH